MSVSAGRSLTGRRLDWRSEMIRLRPNVGWSLRERMGDHFRFGFLDAWEVAPEPSPRQRSRNPRSRAARRRRHDRSAFSMSVLEDGWNRRAAPAHA